MEMITSLEESGQGRAKLSKKLPAQMTAGLVPSSSATAILLS